MELEWVKKVEQRVHTALCRAGCSSAIYKDRHILVFGGRENDIFFLDCWSFDLQNSKLHCLSPGDERAEVRAYHTVTLIDDTAWVIGGTGDDGNTCHTWCFNVKTRVWKAPTLR